MALSYEEFMKEMRRPTQGGSSTEQEKKLSHDEFMQHFGFSTDQATPAASSGGPLKVSRKEGGSQQAAALSATEKANNLMQGQMNDANKKEARQLMKDYNQQLWEIESSGGTLTEEQTQAKRQMQKLGNKMLGDSIKKGVKAAGKEAAELLGYTANQAVNSVKGAASMLTGNPYDYAGEYAENWKKEHNAPYTPLEDIANLVGRNAYAGLAQAESGLASTADLVLPDQITPKAVQSALDAMKKSGEDVTAWADEYNEKAGRGISADIFQAAGGMVPDLLLAMATGGASAAASVPKMATATKAATKADVAADFMKTASETVQQAVQNPQFWFSFSRTWGDSYEEAKSRGASEAQALAAGTLGSLLGAQIEVGGGVQTQFAEAAEKGLKGIAKSAVEEGTEEVLQNLVTNSANAAVFDRSAPLAGLEENAVFNPAREANSFAVGALAGGLMSAPGALSRGNGVQDLFPQEQQLDAPTQAAYNQDEGVIENEQQAQMGGPVSEGSEQLHRSRADAEYQPGGAGNGIPDPAGEGGQSDSARTAEQILERSRRSPYVRRLQDVYDRLEAGTIDGEELDSELSAIAEGVIRAEDYTEPLDESILTRRDYLKQTKIYLNPEEKKLILEAFGETNLGRLNMRQGVRFTDKPQGAVPLDTAMQELAGENLGVQDSYSPVDDMIGLVERNRDKPYVDEDMLRSQRDFLKSRMMAQGKSTQTFDEWLAVASQSNEWGDAPDYLVRLAEREGIPTGYHETDTYTVPEEAVPQEQAEVPPAERASPVPETTPAAETPVPDYWESLFQSDPNGVAPGMVKPVAPEERNIWESLFATDPQAATRRVTPEDMRKLPESPEEARDPYDMATLFRSDPQGRGMSEQAQMDAQTSLRQQEAEETAGAPEMEETAGGPETDADGLNEEQKRQAGLTGDAVKDAFARHPITQRVNYGQNAEEIRQAETNKKALQKEWDMYRSASDSTRAEEADAKQIAAGEKTMAQLSAGSRPEVVQTLANIQTRIARSKETGIQAQKRSIFEHQQAIFKGVLEEIRDPAELVTKENTSIAKLNRRTPERVLRYVFGERLGKELSDLLIRPIHANESAKVQFINQMFDDARQLNLNLVERKLVQLVGEGAKGKDGSIITIDDIKNRSITEESLPGHITKSDLDYIIEHQDEADPEKVKNAVSFYRQRYDSFREVINDFRLEHGMEEIGKRENYFPHFNEDDPLTKTLKQLGIEGASGLPTSIAGETAWFRPNSRYVGYFQKRTGPKTTYDSDLGFQSYVNAVADMLYHTDDIMRLRNFDAVIRGKSKEIDIANTIDSILAKQNLPLDEKDIEVMDKILQGEYMDMEASRNYSTFAQWLTNYTNKLANKQLFGDRSTEEKWGRRAYNIANWIESRFTRNSVVGNIASALNNTIVLPKIMATTDQKYVAKAIMGLRSDELQNLAAESEFLQGKKGVRQLVESPTQKIMRMVNSRTFEPIEEAVSDVAFYAKYLEQMDKNGGDSLAAASVANDYAANMIARRSKGARPLHLETKDPQAKLFTMFQTEISNDWYSLTQDLPEYVKSQVKADNEKEAAKKIAAGAAKYMIYSFALNTLLEAVTGYAPAPDVIRWLWEFGKAVFDDEEDENAVRRVAQATGKLGSEVLNQVPGASTAMALAGLGEGRIPLPDINLIQTANGIYTLFDDPEKSPNKYRFAADQIWNGLVKPAVFSTALPFGGNQLRKTIEGGTALARGGAYKQTKQGEQLQTSVERKPLSVVQGLVFGKSALPEMGEYYDSGAKPKSTAYTEAYQAGYDTAVLDQLFPADGPASYEKMSGGAEGTAEMDSWLNELAASTGRESVLPSNSTTSVTVDGETVKLSGPEQVEFAKTRQKTSYNILSALLPVADGMDEDVQAKYASSAQAYAREVAASEFTGEEPASWVVKVQQEADTSGAEVTDELVNVLLARSIISEAEGDKSPSGRAISGSKKRNATQALVDAGFSRSEAIRLYDLFT